MNLSNLDIAVVMVISLLTSIIVVLAYVLLKERKNLYLELSNTNNIYFGKARNGYIEKSKQINEKTTYIECNYIISISNNINKPYTFRNILIVSKKNRKYKLEEGSLNINGTVKSMAGVTSYDKLKHLVIKPYESIDYDVNIRLSREEYLKCRKIYLSYKGPKNKIYYVKIKINKTK